MEGVGKVRKVEKECCEDGMGRELEEREARVEREWRDSETIRQHVDCNKKFFLYIPFKVSSSYYIFSL